MAKKEEEAKKPVKSDAEHVVAYGKSFCCRLGQVNAGQPVAPRYIDDADVYKSLVKRKILVTPKAYEEAAKKAEESLKGVKIKKKAAQ